MFTSFDTWVTCHIAPKGASIMIEVSASDLVPSGRSWLSAIAGPEQFSWLVTGSLGIVLRHFLISIDGMVHWDLVAPIQKPQETETKTSLENTVKGSPAFPNLESQQICDILWLAKFGFVGIN